MKIFAVILAGLLSCACHSIDQFAVPFPKSGWEPIVELTDEFEDDKLDSAKWHDHNPEWKGRQPGFFSTNNVSVSDGRLHLTARVENLEDLPEGYHTFTTAAVKSRRPVQYGYFEVKARPMKSEVSSGFWFYNNTEEEWTEIDVFEINGVGDEWKNSYNINVHVFHTPREMRHWSKGIVWEAPFDFVDDYHIYGLEWDENAITWYVDGEVVHELKNTHWHQPLYMNFDGETQPNWFGLPKEENLPSTFSIEYVRSWRKKANIEPQDTGDGR